MASAATRASLNNGQIGIILFAFFLLSNNISSSYPILSGFLLAISISKPQLGIFFVLYMLLQRHMLSVIIAFGVHGLAHFIFCTINELSTIGTIKNYIQWQLAVKESGSYYSIDMVLLCNNLGLPDEIIIVAIASLIVFGAFLIHRYRAYPSTQLALLCVLPLFLVYHRPYDFFLLWAVIPLLLLPNSGRFNIVAKILVVFSIIIPYLPTFGYFQTTDMDTFRFVFYVLYIALVFSSVLALIYLSESKMKKERTIG
jgi:hypothetical protein